MRFEQRTGWQPSTTVGFAPGCLRDTTDEIRDERELVTMAVLEQRIDAFVPSGATAVPAPYPTFRLDGTRYPGSAIVVFATKAAQYASFTDAMRRSGGAVVAGGLAANWTGVLPPTNLMKRLEQADIKVVIVELPTNLTFKAVADDARKPTERRWKEALADWRTHSNVAVVTHTANADPAATASAILQEIERSIASGVHREHFGRAMDPRVPDNVAAVPEAFRPLTMLANAGRRLQALGPEYGGALLAAERNDRGAPVVALAYSPFDPVSWASDIASESTLSDHFFAVCGTPCPLETWLTTFRARTLRMPACAAARRALMHGFELAGGLLQRHCRRRPDDAGHQRHQPVIGWPALGSSEQAGFDDAFTRQPVHRPAQALRGPCLATAAAVEHLHDITPRLVGAHSSHCRQPGIETGKHGVEMDGIACRPQLADGPWIPGAQSWVAADPSTDLGRPQPSLGALGDQRPFQLRDSAKHLQRELALRRRGVDGIAQGAEVRALRFQLLDDAEQMRDRAGQAVEAYHHQGLAGPDVAQHLRQHRTATIGARGMLRVHHHAAGGAQFIRLRISLLFLGRDPGVADQAGFGGRRRVPHPHARVLSRPPWRAASI